MIKIVHRKGDGSVTSHYDSGLVPDITLTWDANRVRWYIETQDAAQFTSPQEDLAGAIAERLKDTIAEIVRAHLWAQPLVRETTTDTLLAAIHVLESQVQRYKDENERLLRKIVSNP